MPSEGSTGRLLQLCLGYFVFYVFFGVAVKWLRGPLEMNSIAILTFTTMGGTGIVFPIVILRRWYKLHSNESVTKFGIRFPREYLYIIPSGICTAIVIPTTTLMYTLPITVMVAMTIMRASIIVVSRIVDSIQMRQGLMTRRVYPEENIAIVLALGAVGVHLFYGAKNDGGFDFMGDPAAMTILSCYIGFYAVRIYLMNYFKNTRAPGVKLDNHGFFAIEQFAAMASILLMLGALLLFAGDGPRMMLFKEAASSPPPNWFWGVVAGVPFGLAAFFSVFIYMFKGRTATFAGLVNRLTSLVAGTMATLIFWLGFDGQSPKPQDWIALGFIFASVLFLSSAERKRAGRTASEQR
ncbi:MAG: hypothetical protein JKY56_00305 [Kofleriaceae bacterium]|nr:hypothetical protein [Kofleriaceae bacterium]